MGIIGRDGQELRPLGEGGIHTRGSDSVIPPTMIGRPCVGAWRAGPQTPYTATPRWVHLGKFGSPGIMGADDGQAPRAGMRPT